MVEGNKNDTLLTTRLSEVVDALEEYVTTVAAPVASGDAQQELMALRQENAQLKSQQNQVAERLDTLITRVEQKGV